MKMHRHLLLSTFLFFLLSPAVVPRAYAQLIDSIGSEHVRLRMPAERDSLGRDVAAEIERCYVFMNRSIADRLPRKILIFADWEQSESRCDRENSFITIGMNRPAAALDAKSFLLHSAAREIARLGLLELSNGAQREDTEFLFEGMAEILAHEYEHSSRSLEGAWVICQYLDRMKTLGLAAQRSWTSFSSGKRSFRTAAPGITLLTMYREQLGREVFLKFFDSLSKKSLTASIAVAFKAPAAEVESAWIKRVREYVPPEEINRTEDPPQLAQTTLLPGTAKQGTTIEMQLFLKDRSNNLSPDGVFVQDERTGLLQQPEEVRPTGSYVVKIPVEQTCPPGTYQYKITAIDEAGNLRRWAGSYKVIE